MGSPGSFVAPQLVAYWVRLVTGRRSAKLSLAGAAVASLATAHIAKTIEAAKDRPVFILLGPRSKCRTVYRAANARFTALGRLSLAACRSNPNVFGAVGSARQVTISKRLVQAASLVTNGEARLMPSLYVHVFGLSSLRRACAPRENRAQRAKFTLPIRGAASRRRSCLFVTGAWRASFRFRVGIGTMNRTARPT